jgi:site-specific DNA-methyltransferase (cytosine-N4-specific)
MLTDPGDLVVDIFGGSNTTGQVAEALQRNWLSFELSAEYVAASAFRFLENNSAIDVLEKTYNDILNGKSLDLTK